MASWCRMLRLRLRALFRSDEKETELEREMRFHLESQIEEYLREGMDPELARKEALKEFGGMEKYMEDTRDSWGVRVVSDLIRDTRYSIRSLWKSKGFGFAVVATLALCIGGNTTIFSVLYDLVLKPLPFENSDRIVKIYQVFKGGERFEDSRAGWNQYLDFNQQANLFDGFILAQARSKVQDGKSVDYRGVTANFFDFLGVKPVLGRFFTPAEVYPGPGRVVVLAESTWETEFGSDPGVIGNEIMFARGPSFTVVGVAPRSVEALLPHAKFFAPFEVTQRDLNQQTRGSRGSDMWARLKPGVTKVQAYEQLETLEGKAVEQHQLKWFPVWKMNPQHFEIDPPHPLESSLVLLQAGTLILVIVGCINIANLLLARSIRRSSELSTRYSFGAGGMALSRMMLIESMVLSIAGLVGGFVLSWCGLQMVNRYLIILFPKLIPVQMSLTVTMWNIAVALLIATILGLVPLWLLWRSGRVQSMNGDSRSASASIQSRHTSNVLVVLQMAVTVVVVIGAGLLIRSFQNVLNVDPGFDAARVIKSRINIAPVYPDQTHWLAVRQQIMETLESLPGIEAVSWETDDVSVGTLVNRDRFSIRGGSSDGQEQPDALKKLVRSNYFETLGIKMLEGRGFVRGVDDHENHYVVDVSFAENFLQDRLVLGAEVHIEDPPKTDDGWKRIVGVTERVNYQGLESRDGMPVVYMCFDNIPFRAITVLVRTSRNTVSVISELQASIREVHPELALIDPTTLDRPLNQLHLDRQGFTLVAGLFALLALFLSAIGLFGVLSYDIQQRRREFGIRTAIGATRQTIMLMVLRQGAWKASIGLGIGLLVSAYLTRFLESSLFDVSVVDPSSYVSAVVVILLVALAASYFPARRAVRIDPIQAIQVE